MCGMWAGHIMMYNAKLNIICDRNGHFFSSVIELFLQLLQKQVQEVSPSLEEQVGVSSLKSHPFVIMFSYRVQFKVFQAKL